MRWFLLLALLLACRVVHAEDYRPTYEQYKALCAKGRYQEALPLAEQALRLSEKEFGEAHENTAVLLANIGLIYERLGDYEKAAQLLRRSVDIELRLYGKDSPKVARAFQDLGLVYESLGDYGIAEIAFSRALQIYRSRFGDESPKTKNVASLLARVTRTSSPRTPTSSSLATPTTSASTNRRAAQPRPRVPVRASTQKPERPADSSSTLTKGFALAVVLICFLLLNLALWSRPLGALLTRLSAPFKRLMLLIETARKKRAQAVAERQERLKREQEAERQRRQEELERARAKETHEKMQRQARELAELKRWANAERQQRLQREAELQRKQEELEHARAKEAHERMQRRHQEELDRVATTHEHQNRHHNRQEKQSAPRAAAQSRRRQQQKYEKEKEQLERVVAEVRSLDVETAKRISGMVGDWSTTTEFPCLASITPQVASQLRNLRGSLSLPALGDIDAESARLLMSSGLHELSLGGIRRVSREVASGLATGFCYGRKTRLFMKSLESAELAVARELRKCVVNAGAAQAAVNAATPHWFERPATIGWGIAAVAAVILFGGIVQSCANARPMTASERYYWDHGPGRAIRDEQEFYDNKWPDR